MTISPARSAMSVSVLLCAGLAPAQTAPDSGIDFVTVGAPGNPAYHGPDPVVGYVTGRGSVPYEYRIGRTEVTTAQWMEFVNAYAGGAPGTRPHFAEYIPAHWGAVPDPVYQGPGERWRLDPSLPRAAVLPVSSIAWRDAAMYCNWLHGGKSTDAATLQTGAYDTSTWGYLPGTGQYTDAPTHLPGARFWIPTLDEWIKAAHYDPDRYGAGGGGWWQYPTGSDAPPVPGLPGRGGQTSAGLPFDFANYDIPLGAYPGVLSPWGLLDASGGSTEWTEEYWADNRDRLLDGGPVGPFFTEVDRVDLFITASPGGGVNTSGLRVAAAVPNPPVFLLVGITVSGLCLPRKRIRSVLVG